MKLPTPHQRLLGTWKSDRRRTFRNWRPSSSMTPAQVRKFKSLFGLFTIRWTRKKYYAGFDDCKKGIAYEVVASDEDSLVIRAPQLEILGGGFVLSHIHFDDDFNCYWMAINMSTGFVEWFRRVP